MITSGVELQATRERIGWFEDQLARMRVAAQPQDFPLMASGYLAAIDQMQREVTEYLGRHASQPSPAKVS
jgi:hypothetical protein